MSFVLVSNFDYYLGKTYIYQGGWYASFGSRQEAKRYGSKARAERAAEALTKKVGYTFVVEEVKDGRETD